MFCSSDRSALGHINFIYSVPPSKQSLPFIRIFLNVTSQGTFEGSIMMIKNKALQSDRLGYEAQLSHLLTLWTLESYLWWVTGLVTHPISTIPDRQIKKIITKKIDPNSGLRKMNHTQHYRVLLKWNWPLSTSFSLLWRTKTKWSNEDSNVIFLFWASLVFLAWHVFIQAELLLLYS